MHEQGGRFHRSVRERRDSQPTVWHDPQVCGGNGVRCRTYQRCSRVHVLVLCTDDGLFSGNHAHHFHQTAALHWLGGNYSQYDEDHVFSDVIYRYHVESVWHIDLH